RVDFDRDFGVKSAEVGRRGEIEGHSHTRGSHGQMCPCYILSLARACLPVLRFTALWQTAPSRSHARTAATSSAPSPSRTGGGSCRRGSRTNYRPSPASG